MNENNIKNNFFKKFQNFIYSNLRNILILIAIIFLIFLSFQIYIYFSDQKLKNTSLKFFNSIQAGSEILDNLNEIKKSKNIYSTLSTLKLIQLNNEKKKFSISNELYKELIFSKNLDNLYKSSIAIHASYSLINASYIEKSNNYFNDISMFISNISDELESYYSIKREIEYLFFIAKLDINGLDYKNNMEVLNLYNNISNSNLISSSIKERVKKIHEFHIYK
tara:strand:+ start:1444 stop:2109 length:666 start_codon:yes stop_codon:yes gene_type:complete